VARDIVRTCLHLRPRISAALSFGGATALVTHFAWHADARLSGIAPALTVAAALAHAAGGSVTGARLLDPNRTRTTGQAAAVGAITSLVALVLFAPAMAAYVASSDAVPPSPVSYAMLTVFTAVFSFLAVGWALLIVSTAVGVILYRLARSHPSRGDGARGGDDQDGDSRRSGGSGSRRMTPASRPDDRPANPHDRYNAEGSDPIPTPCA
jgi:hypothetical protein